MYLHEENVPFLLAEHIQLLLEDGFDLPARQETRAHSNNALHPIVSTSAKQSLVCIRVKL